MRSLKLETRNCTTAPNIAGKNSVDTLRVLITREQIAAKVAQMGERITADFAGESIVLLGVLKGAAIFLADLARQIKLDATFDFIAVSSYGSGKRQSGEVKLTKDVDRSVEGRNILCQFHLAALPLAAAIARYSNE